MKTLFLVFVIVLCSMALSYGGGGDYPPYTGEQYIQNQFPPQSQVTYVEPTPIISSEVLIALITTSGAILTALLTNRYAKARKTARKAAQ